MPEDLKAQVIIEAQDRASAIIKNVAGELGAFGEVMQTLASKGGVVGASLAAIGAAIGAITLTGVKLAEQVETLDSLSAKTGVAVDNLQVMQQLLKEMGGDVGSLSTALTQLNRSIATNDPLLKQLGITSKDTFTAFMQLSQAFANSDDTAKKTEIAFQLMGRGAADLLSVMPKLSTTFNDAYKSMDAVGGILKGDVLTGARALDEQADRLDRAWTTMMTNIKASTLPTARSVIEAMNDMFDAMAGRRKSPEEEAARQVERLQTQLTANVKFLRELHATGASEGYIKEIEGLVERLKLKIRELQGLAVTGDETELFEKAFLQPDKQDLVAKAKVSKPTELTEREKAIQHIIELTRVGRAEAEYYYGALNRIEGANLLERLKAGPEVPAEVNNLNKALAQLGDMFSVDAERAQDLFANLRWDAAMNDVDAFMTDLGLLAQEFGVSGEAALDFFLTIKENGATGLGQILADVKELSVLMRVPTAEALQLYEQLRALDEEQRRLATKRKLNTNTPDDEVEDFRKAMDSILGVGNITRETLDGVFQALQSGFGAAMQDIVAGTATAGSIIKTMWHAIVDAIIAELARITAAKVVSGVAGFVASAVSFLAGLFATTPELPAPEVAPVMLTLGPMPPLPPASIVADFAPLPPLPNAVLTADWSLPPVPDTTVTANWALPPIPNALVTADLEMPPVPEVIVTAEWAMPPVPDAIAQVEWGALPPVPDATVMAQWGAMPRVPDAAVTAEWEPFPPVPDATVMAEWGPLPPLSTQSVMAEWELPPPPTPDVVQLAAEVPETEAILNASWAPLPPVPRPTVMPRWGAVPPLPTSAISRLQSLLIPSFVAARVQPLPVARAATKPVESVRVDEAKKAAAEEPVPQNVTNVMVLGYDNHSIVADLTSPSGKLRAAYSRVSFMGAY